MARLLPSLLFLPASSQKILSSALKIPATKVPHAFVLDLEDSVPLSQKAVARENAVDVLSKVADGGWRGDAEIWVRINGVGTGEEVEDLKAILPCKALRGIVVSKTESNEDLDFVESFVQSLAPRENLSRLTFHPLIESPNSLLRLPFKNRRIASLSMAAEDFKAAVSLQPSPESVALQYARQAIVNMARAMRVTPLDMVYVDVKDPVGLEKECVQGREMGFGGKWCIHPSQIEACNKVFGAEDQPKKASYADVDWN